MEETSTPPTARIVGVITAGFMPKNEAEIIIALNEAAGLGLLRIILVHDTKGKSGRYVDAAILATADRYAAAGIELVRLAINDDETALRWRHGVDAALDDPSVDCAILLPSDFSVDAKEQLCSGLREMIREAGRDSLVIGDFKAKSASFKELFDRDLIGLRAVEAMFPGASAEILRHGLRKLRSEFSCIGRNVLVRARKEMTLWDMDPLVSMVLVVLRATELNLEVVDLGDFDDNPGTRTPLGQLTQLVRFAAQLAVNGIRLENSRWPADELAVYDHLRPRIEATFQVCLEGIDANRRLLQPAPTPLRRKFNTNNKTLLSLNIGWQDFRGFSLLADPEQGDLVEGPAGVVTMHNSLGSNKLFDALRNLVFGPWGNELEEEFLFARLPHYSYHVTVKDGVNIDNLHLLDESSARTFRSFFAGLPSSLTDKTAEAIQLGSIPLSSPIRFKFTKLTIWNRSALVARIEPVDEDSRLLVAAIKDGRERLDQEWEQAWGLPRPKNTGWSPHISLGYFPNRDIAPIAETRLERWSEQFAATIGGATCEFCSISPYTFTDMATFAKTARRPTDAASTT